MNYLDKNYIIENLFIDDDFTSDEFNNIVINKISVYPGWYLSNDEERQNQKVDSDFSDSGMLLESYYDSSFYCKSNGHTSTEKDEINMMGNLIFQKILQVLPFEFENLILIRFLWNYYNRSSVGVSHKDISEKNEGNFCSIVYHLNTCDGQTIIEDCGLTSKSGQCLIFDSKKLHQGTGPKVHPKRYCLNIVFKYDSIRYK